MAKRKKSKQLAKQGDPVSSSSVSRAEMVKAQSKTNTKPYNSIDASSSGSKSETFKVPISAGKKAIETLPVGSESFASPNISMKDKFGSKQKKEDSKENYPTSSGTGIESQNIGKMRPEEVNANGDHVFAKPMPPESTSHSYMKQRFAKLKSDLAFKKELLGKVNERAKWAKKRIKDPRLIPRMKEYLDSRPNKNFVSIPLMTEYLQKKYPEYGRKKKATFQQYVDRAYSILEEPQYNTVAPDSGSDISDSEETSYLALQKGEQKWKTMGGEDNVSSDSSDDGEDESGENLMEYKDTNSMNNMMANMYRQKPQQSSTSSDDERKRKPETTLEMSKRLKVEKENSASVKVIYPSPNALERNLSSTGLTGPRRSSLDKYFIDRKGDNESNQRETNGVDSREKNIQEFLGSLPSRTSFSAYVNTKKDPRMNTGSLYRVYKGIKEHQGDSLVHSGITPENTGVTNEAPKSPCPESQTGQCENDIYRAGNEEPFPSKISTKASSKDREDQRLEKQTVSERPRTPRKKKGSKSRRQEDSDTETGKKEKGPAVQKSTVTFADVGGNESSLTEICKLLVHMRHPEVYQQLGVTPPRGFLLHGPPGCGKTLLANAIAGELDLPLIKIAATEIVSGVSGDSEERVRDLFDKAVKTAPCVVFIDEIDSITPKRETASKDMERRIVAQLLACMDDLNANTSAHVLVIGATNRPDSLDPALRRAGRFDREICLGIPDEQSRLRILQVLCRNLRLTPDFDFAYLAKNSPGYVGADLMALTREAAMTAVNRVFQDLQSQISANCTSDSETGVNTLEMATDHTPQTGSKHLCSSTEDRTEQKTNTAQALNGAQTESDNTENSNMNLLSWTLETDKESNNIDSAEAIGANITNTETAGASLDTNGMKLEACDNVGEKHNEKITNSSNEIVVSCNTVGSLDTTTESKENPLSMDVDSENNNNSTIEVESEKMCDIQSESNQKKAENQQLDSEAFSSEQIHCDKKSNASQTGELYSVLSWLKDQPPLTEDQLRDLFITLEDFKEALKYVQPSAKREGFATIPDVTWDDIGALHDVREELQLAILAPVRHAEAFKSLGLNRAQGVLLAGPPGCGKTLLAKAVANESGINFISVKGPELLNMYVGESERAVRTVFQRARNSSPCVIFFDELDALCPRRSGNAEGGSSARVVNQLLTEMDGLEERKQVFIMAATNRPDIIDPAVLRPGRLDKTLYVGLPTVADRLDIFKCITKNGTQPCLSSDVDLAKIAEDEKCEGYTGADLAALVREASVSALKEAIVVKGRQPSDVITVRGEHFETAFRKIKPSVSAKDQEKYRNMGSKLITE